ncbi:hypothetical protein DFH11DRAFT_1881375 [Phellopilus nigrolimitatus]|nr:hypothetical protein DFH11DRAFT_1881375 [Phellopilus nigrolimitatus]
MFEPSATDQSTHHVSAAELQTLASRLELDDESGGAEDEVPRHRIYFGPAIDERDEHKWTPLTVRTRASYLPDRLLHQPQTYDNMGATLLNEVKDSKFDDVPGLLERKFSDEVLARGVGQGHVDISAIFEGLKKMGARIGGYLPHKTRPGYLYSGSWSNWLRASNKCHEAKVSHYVNAMMLNIEEMFPTLRRNRPRVFDARFTDSAPAGVPVPCLRKPDMVLLDRNDAKQEEVSWSQIRSTWELKALSKQDASQSAHRRKSFEQLLQSARLIFASQSNRRFVCGMTMVNDDAKFYVFDRSGVVSSETFNIHTEPEKFLRAVLGFFLADDTDLGLDPSIVYEGKKRFMTVDGIKYEIVREIYVESCVRGRGTVCFLAVHDNKEYVIKDSWVDKSRQIFEHKMLERVKHVDGVPTMIAHECVKMHGTEDTTATDRAFLNDPEILEALKPALKKEWTEAKKKTETREHQRIIIEPFGERLETFCCLYELVLGVKDIVQIIKKLADEGVLHRDISLRNIILAKNNSGGPFRKAFLIDFDYAIDLLEQMLDHAKGNRTGTLPFMAIEVLQSHKNGKPKHAHAYYHDLESVFYVLCWLCTVLEGPYNKERDSDNFDFESSEITKWSGFDIPNASLNHIWKTKQAVMRQCLCPFVIFFSRFRKDDPETLETLLNTLDDEMKKPPKDRNKLLIDYAKLRIPLSKRKRDEVFAEINEVLDKTLKDLSSKGKDKPEAPPPGLKRTPNAYLDGHPQNAASRVKYNNVGDGALREDGEKEETIVEEDEGGNKDVDMTADANADGDGEGIDSTDSGNKGGRSIKSLGKEREERVENAVRHGTLSSRFLADGEGDGIGEQFTVPDEKDDYWGTENEMRDKALDIGAVRARKEGPSSNHSLFSRYSTSAGSKRSLGPGDSEGKAEMKRRKQE